MINSNYGVKAYKYIQNLKSLSDLTKGLLYSQKINIKRQKPNKHLKAAVIEMLQRTHLKEMKKVGKSDSSDSRFLPTNYGDQEKKGGTIFLKC